MSTLLAIGGANYALVKPFPKIQQHTIDVLADAPHYLKSISAIFKRGLEPKGGTAITTRYPVIGSCDVLETATMANKVDFHGQSLI